MDEARLLRMLQEALPPGAVESPDLRTPPWGDDAAVVAAPWVAPDRELVVTTDLLVEDVDFRWAWASPEDVGFKALQVNLSDLAAKGAEPRQAYVGIACRRDEAATLLPRLYRGLGEALADAPGLTVAGGDLSATGGPLVIALTLVGDAPRGGAWRRMDAAVGDILWVSRPVGWARLGLLALEQGDTLPAPVERAIAQFRRPRAELPLARVLRDVGYSGACMDLSDGLQRDLPRLCGASGVGALVVDPGIAQPAGYAELCAALGADPTDNAVQGGEDFALLGATDPLEFHRISQAVSAAQLRLPIPIGSILPASHGITLQLVDGRAHPWPSGGFDHFAAPRG
ncbi:MAG TPA: thiamine-phosphate kinase [bacterium]|nr:thiamine-phosphate kinase [bacterium]